MNVHETIYKDVCNFGNAILTKNFRLKYIHNSYDRETDVISPFKSYIFEKNITMTRNYSCAVVADYI